MTGVGQVLFKIYGDMHEARRLRPQNPSLFSLLSSRRGLGATNLRDLIYGHLAVAGLPKGNNVPSCPVVDYQKSVQDVFMDATVYMLKEGFATRLVLLYDIQLHAPRMSGLPSWVPDCKFSVRAITMC